MVFAAFKGFGVQFENAAGSDDPAGLSYCGSFFDWKKVNEQWTQRVVSCFCQARINSSESVSDAPSSSCKTLARRFARHAQTIRTGSFQWQKN
jgi:hypothetical protein